MFYAHEKTHLYSVNLQPHFHQFTQISFPLQTDASSINTCYSHLASAVYLRHTHAHTRSCLFSRLIRRHPPVKRGAILLWLSLRSIAADAIPNKGQYHTGTETMD